MSGVATVVAVRGLGGPDRETLDLAAPTSWGRSPVSAAGLPLATVSWELWHRGGGGCAGSATVLRAQPGLGWTVLPVVAVGMRVRSGFLRAWLWSHRSWLLRRWRLRRSFRWRWHADSMCTGVVVGTEGAVVGVGVDVMVVASVGDLVSFVL